MKRHAANSFAQSAKKKKPQVCSPYAIGGGYFWCNVYVFWSDESVTIYRVFFVFHTQK